MWAAFLPFMIAKISCLSKIWGKILRPYLSNSLTGMYYCMQNRVGWDYKKRVFSIRRCCFFWMQSREPRHSYCQADDHWSHYRTKWQLSFMWDDACAYWRTRRKSLGGSAAGIDPRGAANVCGDLSVPSKSQTRGDPAWERSSRVYVLVGQLLC